MCLALVVAACASPAPSPTLPVGSPTAEPAATPGGSRDPGQAVHTEATAGPFTLVFELGDDTWRAGEPIAGRAWLTVAGGSAELYGSGSGLLAFDFREVDGSRRMEAAWTDDCQPYRLEAGSPLSSGITKSGGFGGDDPNAAFYRAFFADPLVRLPAGRWEITATASFGVGDCGGERTIRAPIMVTIEP